MHELLGCLEPSFWHFGHLLCVHFQGSLPKLLLMRTRIWPSAFLTNRLFVRYLVWSRTCAGYSLWLLSYWWLLLS